MLSLLRIVAGILILGASVAALLAVLGAVVAELDVLNHLQILIFPATVIGLVLALLLFRQGAGGAFFLALALASFGVSAVTFLPEAVSAVLPRPAPPSDGRPVLKGMTHNLFGLNQNMERVAQNIFREDPDILALQEYFYAQHKALHPLLLPRYPYFAYCTGGKRANIGLYSKLPFTEKDTGTCNDQAGADVRTSRILATLTLSDGTSLSVLTTHLDWPLPAARQQQQMAVLADAAKAVEGPLIVMGDMNSTPWSFALRRLVARAGLERQTRSLITYPLAVGGDDGLIRTIPFLPLDQVMTRGLAVHDVHTASDDGSDHLPVVFTFSVEKAEP